MKAEFDKEIDALLRRNVRAAGRVARAPQTTASPHLDADELSAFAENALPAPARLAAVSHLADCDQCRGAVVTLASAAGEFKKRAAVPVSVDPSEAVPKVGWFAALFSPRLLRFVAPALAVVLVGAVAFVILRTRRDAGSVAQHTAAPEAARPGIIADADPNANSSANMNANTSMGTTANTNANAAARPESGGPPRGADADRVAAAPVVEAPDGADAGPVNKAASEPPADAGTEVAGAAPPPPPATTNEPAPAAVAPAPNLAASPATRDAPKQKKEDRKAAEDDELARADEAQPDRRAQQPGNLDVQQVPDGSRQRSANSAVVGRAAPRAASREPERERSSRSIGGAQSRGEAGGGAAREESRTGGETSAAGHRFRREGNAWVDVKYRPSMSMTGVRRGTEAFRALVADIPEVGRIAQQLSGEFIAVVNGRAYRIR